MSSPDPFTVLGVPPTASLAEVRAARRRLAQRLHPDHGGDEARMRDLNLAFDLAIKAVRGRTAKPPSPPAPPAAPATKRPAARKRSTPSPTPGRPRRIRVVERDEASFVVQARPEAAFGALVAAARWLGEMIDGELPWWLEARVEEPSECWCRLELLPEGDAAMVALTVAHIEGNPWPPPSVDDVRDAWIEALGSLSA